MITDDMWVVPADTWPSFDIDPEEFRKMLGQFDEYWGYAVESLAEMPDGGEA